MNTLRQHFGKSETFTESQKWVVGQLIPIFPCHIRSGIEAVVGMQTADIHPFDSRVLLQQCIDFILDNNTILEAAVNEYTATRIDLTGPPQLKSGASNRKIDYRDQAYVIDSDEDEYDELRMVGAVADIEALWNNNQNLYTSSKFGSNQSVGTKKTPLVNLVDSKFASHVSGSKNNSLTSAMAHEMLQTDSMGLPSSAKRKSSDVPSLKTQTTDSTVYSVPPAPNTTSTTVIPNSSFLISNACPTFSQLVNTMSMVPLPSRNMLDGGGAIGAPNSLSELGQVGGVSVTGTANHSSTQGQIGGVSIVGTASHSSTQGQIGGVSIVGTASHSSTQGQIGGVSIVGTASHSSTQKHKGGVNVTGSQTPFTTGLVNGTTGVLTRGASSTGSCLLTPRHVVGVSMTGLANKSSRSDNVGVAGSASQSSVLACVGGALTSPSLSSSLPFSPSLAITSCPGVITINGDAADVNTMPVPPKQSIAEQVEEMKDQVLQLFPNVEPTYVTDLIRLDFGPHSVNTVCNVLLEYADYPKVQKTNIVTVPKQQIVVENKIDYFKEYDQLGCFYSEDDCSRRLQNDFQKVSVKDISRVLRMFNGHYAPAYKAFFDAMEQAYNVPGNKTADQKIRPAPKSIKVRAERAGGTITVNLLKGKRIVKRIPPADPHLEQEIDFIKRKLAAEKQEADEKYAWQLNENEYEDSGQLIECSCCYGENPFESMVQCYDGHLFCRECLLNYAKEAVYGSGKLGLACMAADCEASFPVSEMKRSLPENLLKQYEERIRESDLNLADLEDLVRCPHCDYAVIMAPGDKVFKCQTPTCMKETCRYCQEEWSDHIGIPCNELEKKDESHLRKQYEEKMTEAKVRTCHRCKKKFMKDEGCNKMVCTCNATMCYICRKPNIDYNHFCGHVREPGHACSKCKACSLWTNPDEDDNRAIREIQEEANEKRKEKGYEENKLIGAPAEPPAKKRKV
ncbi:uncharacterized protein LOC121379156 isoform X2 [Gigantopelta aegis]|uniref:uncharacterized protein LOC121379156 isoform X2 n=1 Tax=Gigantopelta aegis TaxID=1735272 RepID=UPI001B88C0CB|nr:uncharacterized protein LOC121379156 isoform X2 [Gigantopelta aegis]